MLPGARCLGRTRRPKRPAAEKGLAGRWPKLREAVLQKLAWLGRKDVGWVAGCGRKTLLDRLTTALVGPPTAARACGLKVWEELTLQEIRRECQSRDVCFTGLRSRNEAEQRRELGERLFVSARACGPARPVKELERIGSSGPL